MTMTLPEGLTMRPPTMDDLKIVHEFYLAHDLEVYGEEDMTLTDLHMYWTAPTHDLARDQRLVFDQSGQLLANLYLDQEQHAKFFIDVLVRTTYRDVRLGNALLQLGEVWARERMVQAEPRVRITLNARASSNDQGALERYARMGMQEIRRFWEMAIELNETPSAPEWPEGVVLRPFVRERDARAVFETMDTAFQDHWGHMSGNFEAWQHRKFDRANFDASLWFIAWEGHQVAGSALCTRDNHNGGWINTLGVLRPWRRQGLGLALLRHAFCEFYRRGLRKASLGVDSQNLTGATRLYKQAGMTIQRENIIFEKELRAGVELSTRELAN